MLVSSATEISEIDHTLASPAHESDNFPYVFRAALVDSIKQFLTKQQPVFLDGLGYISPHKERNRETHRDTQVVAFRNETILALRFEKTLEADSDLYPNHIATHELAREVLLRIPLKHSLNLSEKILRKSIRSFFRDLRQELISFGISAQLAEIGSFYAYSNNDYGTISELFTSAEIFFEPKFKQVLECSEATCFDSPIFFNAWEPLETAYQEPIQKWQLNFLEQLELLGFEINSDDQLSQNSVAVAAFAVPSEKNGKLAQIIFCTDGLRHPIVKQDTELYDQEITVQIEIEPHLLTTPEELPEWPLKIITLGWLLLQGYKNKSLKDGLVFTHSNSLNDDPKSKITAIITNTFKKLPGRFYVEDNYIRYLNLTGITAQEASLASTLSSHYLLQILKFKELDQLTKPTRTSFVRK